MVPSVKESVKFKLNTECLGGLSLLFFSRTQQHYGNRWFSRYVIAAMLVDGKQKIAH